MLRLTVLTSGGRHDLRLPADLPVADLVPEVARRVGLLGDDGAQCPLELVAGSGRVLRPELGLASQGVVDGCIVSLVETVDPPNEIYDDPVEALSSLGPDDGDGRWMPSWRGVGLAVGVLTVVLVLAGLVAHQARDPAVGALLLLGLVVFTGDAILPAAALASGLVGVGAVAALGTPVSGVDVGDVGAKAESARQLVTMMCAGSGLLLALAAPVVVSAGRSGSLAAGLASAVVLLRSRRLGRTREVAAGLVAGASGALAIAVSVLLVHPAWAVVTATGLIVIGVLATVAPVPGPESWPRALGVQAADLLELASLLAFLPTLVIASGAAAAIAARVP